MIEKIINECEQALEYELYLAALTLALTLPDICAKAEYPTLRNKERYVNWCKKHIEPYEKSPNDDMPYLSGEVLYSLRCSMLHQGTPNVEKDKCNIEKFQLIVGSRDIIKNYPSEIRMIYGEENHLTLNIRSVCLKICRIANRYYQDNKELFDFFNYYLFDLDEYILQREKCYNFGKD